MSNSGSGREAQFSERAEPLEDPKDAAYEALLEIPHLYPSDVMGALAKLNEKGLTICWKAPGDE